MPCTEWSNLTPLQLGRYAEYYAKMEFASYGYEVFTSEVDDKGVDFICRKNDGPFCEIQVKAVRKYNPTFMLKDHMDVKSKDRFICLLRFEDGSLPEVYLIPANAWDTPTALLKGYDYVDKKSKPDWSINLSKKNMPLLQEHEFSRTLEMMSQAGK